MEVEADESAVLQSGESGTERCFCGRSRRCRPGSCAAGWSPDFLVCHGVCVCLTHRRRRHHQSGVVVVDGLHREPGPAGTAHTPWSDNLGVGVQWSETYNATDFEQDLIPSPLRGPIRHSLRPIVASAISAIGQAMLVSAHPIREPGVPLRSRGGRRPNSTSRLNRADCRTATSRARRTNRYQEHRRSLSGNMGQLAWASAVLLDMSSRAALLGISRHAVGCAPLQGGGTHAPPNARNRHCSHLLWSPGAASQRATPSR